jgi:hypothetical protein
VGRRKGLIVTLDAEGWQLEAEGWALDAGSWTLKADS